MIDLSNRQKERLAGIVRQPLAAFILSMAVRILVTRHRTGVTLVCFNGQNRILMLRHVFRPSTPWDLPGGWLERNESPADCALRELREETGLLAVLGPVVQVERVPVISHINITYMARLAPPVVEPALSSEILEAAWFSQAELPSPLSPSTRTAIRAAVANIHHTQSMERITDV